MKLASLKQGRDGKLVVVSRDLLTCISADHIVPTLQNALDNWDSVSPKLAQLSDDLNTGKIKGESFDPAACHSPLPRAYQWIDGSTYYSHVELARKARGAEMPTDFATNPLMYQGGSDVFLGPREDIAFENLDWGIDFEGEIAAITGDVPMGATAKDAADSIKLLMLVNDISLRYIAQEELKKGFGFIQAKPSTAFSPVAVTPDELGADWREGRIHLPLKVYWNGDLFGAPEAGEGSTFNFEQLIAHAAKTRALCAGTIVGSGTVSNKKELGRGQACILERRMIEKIENDHSATHFMQYGDRVKIEMTDKSGASIFGSIEQKLVPYQKRG